ncbi:type I polyketide synthase [Streptantibioticus ferralitis]|uniref:Beta-ketoacyl synthase N-terminal-like domain-containing protein n=1 Tax=Streptantibioticus ferralitis TaxID=236510 RepID=A0ABT5ZCZ8_9ACTN|nr:beta-ketoacyl synthase N-terminal-like domain-containing protein [Streptantibioticus ferralitis]MDF2261512.1 beta-ketoacyl synthase N-terminal-like domain-containing protein [Streptantibioticus ferralitis]
MTRAAQPVDPDSPFLAVVGMAGRYPGARDLGEFWENLIKGVESVTRFPGDPSTPGYVPAFGVLEGADEFDAGFFGYSPREALILDPQQRLFLTGAWEALEDAGYDARSCAGPIGVYAGSSQTGYLDTLMAHRDRLGPVSEWQLRLATGIDFLTSRVAHRLGLTGPAVTVQTACSTSLVAVHVAAQALLSGECDLALAGGASVNFPTRLPEYSEGGVISPDGRCRAFDAQARGTVGANGVGIVVLKRLADALEDGDHIRAVLRGTAVNNDGMDKVGFTAPGVAGQAEVIRAAHLVAEVEPDSIGYVETHGTGTPLGDPIELAALTQAFRRGTERRGYCRIGSVKTNIGHTDAAAGVAGFIKAVLAVQHGLIPSSLHYTSPNPEIPFEDSPFMVNTELYEWRSDGPRRAGVSSFGIGGTNAHAVLEEPPARAPRPAAPGSHLLVLSARTAHELDRAATRLAEHLQGQASGSGPGRDLAETAWTLQTGRRAFAHRRFAVAADRTEAIEALACADAGGHPPVPGERPVVFVFPGHGGQHAGMGRELYEDDPVFRGEVDACCAYLAPTLGLDLRTVLYPAGEQQTTAAEAALRDMGVAQPAVFVVEYALARMWQRRGVRPAAVAGHSLGAFAAACVAGVLCLPDALRLVAERGRLMRTLPAGAMLAVPLAEHDATELLGDGLELAAVNGPNQCVLSGPQEAIDAVFTRLTAEGVDVRRLDIAAGGHSALVEPILNRFAAMITELDLKAPSIPWVGDTTGDWVRMDRAPGAEFWTTHMRQPVRFGDTLATLLAEPDRILLEVGPGRALTTLARRHPARTEGHLALPSLPHPADEESALRTSLAAAGRLWAAGVELDWAGLHEGNLPGRTALPTYPFSPQRYSPLPADGPAPTVTAEPSSTVPQPAREGDTEAQLAQLFGQLLGLDKLAAQDDFFDLGGDSLIAVQLVSALRAAFGVRITVKQVFTAPTARRLARVVDDARQQA